MRVEKWNGHNIRFIEVDGEWCAVAKDVAKALGYSKAQAMLKLVDGDNFMVSKMDNMNMLVSIVNELGIYEAVMGSHKQEASDFKKWVFATIKELRKSTGLEGFEAFKMLDKEHQREAMRKLYKGLSAATSVDYIKANQITNRVVSSKHGRSRLVKKGDMSPEMLLDRAEVLEDVTTAMIANERLDLGISVSDTVHRKHLEAV